jgi:hypothetical protein
VRPRVSEELWQAFSDFNTPALASGQIWRLCWNEDCSIAVIYLHDEDASITAFPVTEDVQFATNYDLILQAEESALGTPSMIQVGLETGIARFVLERCLGAIGESAANDLSTLRAAFARGETADMPLGRVGPPLMNELDERHQFRLVQREMLAVFSLADWLDSFNQEATPISELLDKKVRDSGRSAAFKEISDATSIPLQDLVRLWQRRGTMDKAMASPLASYFHLESTQLQDLGDRPPPELVDVMNHPSHKRRFHRYSQEWHADESETRRRIARTLVGARKRAKELSAQDWERLLEERFPL